MEFYLSKENLQASNPANENVVDEYIQVHFMTLWKCTEVLATP